MNRDKNRTGAEIVFAEEKNIKGFGKNTNRTNKNQRKYLYFVTGKYGCYSLDNIYKTVENWGL